MTNRLLTVVMMKLGRGIHTALLSALVTALAMLATGVPAAAASLVVQPDGKIVLAGKTWPEFGALARLNPDGSLDPSFGQGGFAIDQRAPSFAVLALQPDGRIVGAGGPGTILARYLPEGAPDLGFASGGLGGTYEPGQFSSPGPSALLVRPDGSLVVAKNTSLLGGGAEAWIGRYDAAGNLVETVGHVPPLGGPADASRLNDLVEGPDGSLFGVGSTYETAKLQALPLLARFVPGSGTNFDHGFASGAGLARPAVPSKAYFSPGFGAVAWDEGKLLAAGTTAGTLLLARFDPDGNLDPGFGEGGYVAPPIVGPGAGASIGAIEEASSGAGALAAMPDGDVVLGGGTSQWSNWAYMKNFGVRCSDCPQPLLARFDGNGKLDPSFGSGGILRLLKPDGSTFIGDVQQVTALDDGKILVNGFYGKPFVARLNPDGSYDPSFGEGGLVTLRFPCSDQSLPELRQAGCHPSALLKLSLRGLRRGRPALSLRVAPNLPWAAIGGVNVILPRGVRLTKKFKSRLRIVPVGASERGAEVEVTKPKRKGGRTELFFTGFGEAKELRVKLKGGSLRTSDRQRLHRRALRLPINVLFTGTAFREHFETTQKLVRRVRSAG
jgi:uncharacterized delta-60 repeat protein